MVAAGVGEVVVAGATAGAALQPLVQPVATGAPQAVQGEATAQGAGAAQVLHGAGAAQQAFGAQAFGAQHRVRTRWQRTRWLQQPASTSVATEKTTATAANKQNARLILNSFT